MKTFEEYIESKEPTLLHNLKQFKLWSHIDELNKDYINEVVKNNSVLDDVIERSEQFICDHPKDQREGYHDSAIKCNKCKCIIEQFGKEINPPVKLSII